MGRGRLSRLLRDPPEKTSGLRFPYVDLNPVRAVEVGGWGDYAWSGHHAASRPAVGITLTGGDMRLSRHANQVLWMCQAPLFPQDDFFPEVNRNGHVAWEACTRGWGPSQEQWDAVEIWHGVWEGASRGGPWWRIPEPGTMALLAGGLCVVLLGRRARRPELR